MQKQSTILLILQARRLLSLPVAKQYYTLTTATTLYNTPAAIFKPEPIPNPLLLLPYLNINSDLNGTVFADFSINVGSLNTATAALLETKLAMSIVATDVCEGEGGGRWEGYECFGEASE